MYRRLHHILIVDDDPAAQYQTIRLLQQRDYALTTAWTLEDAYARLVEMPFDLIVAGTRIGSLSGLQFVLSARSRVPEVAGLLIAPQREHIPEMEAWRYGVVPVVLPLEPEHFLMTVAETLASIGRRQRWPRKQMPGEVAVTVEGATGRILDVSYGGLRLAIAGESYDLRDQVRVDIPSAGLRVNGQLVWSARGPDGATCLCGIAIVGEHHPVPIWQEFVDGLESARQGAVAANPLPTASGR
jgi:CheY-like chemotaxis protein